ncbi:Hypothetical predicted protein [Scomber scombrus]|uniref:Secreted protein n=1 Tax=Scomber scombrus TaxID=13677 RepID=A0AAV1MRP0_SCOSC
MVKNKLKKYTPLIKTLALLFFVYHRHNSARLCKLSVTSAEAGATSLLPTAIPLKAYLKPWLQLQAQRTTYATKACCRAQRLSDHSADTHTETVTDTTRRGTTAGPALDCRQDQTTTSQRHL